MTIFACYRCGEPGTPWHTGEPEMSDSLFVFEGVDAAEKGCRATVLHRECYEGDMWTDRAEWTGWSPRVPWDRLPTLVHSDDDSEFDVEQYPALGAL